MKRTLTTILSCLLALCLVSGLQAYDFTLQSSSMLAGSYNHINFDGAGNAYMFNSYGVEAFNVGAPATPVLLSTVATPGASHMGGYQAYAATDHFVIPEGDLGITVVEVWDFPMDIRYTFDVGGPCRVLDAQEGGNYYAFCAVEGVGIVVVDLSDYNNPFIAGTYSDPDLVVRDIKYRDEYLYLAADDSGLVILNVQDINDITIEGSWTYPGIHALALTFHPLASENKLYLALGNPGILEMNISDLQNPTNIGLNKPTLGPALDVEGYAFSTTYYVAVSEGYDATETAWIQIYYPAGNMFVASDTLAGPGTRVTIQGGNAYVCEGYHGFEIYSVWSPYPMTWYCNYVEPGGPRTAQKSGNYAYIANYTGGLSIMDMSDFENPDSVSTVPTTLWCYDVALMGDYAYAIDWMGELIPVNVSTPSMPTVGTIYYGAEGFRALDIYNGYIYVGCYNGGGVVVTEVNTDPMEPTYVTTLDPPGAETDIKGITVADGKLYVCAYDAGLLIYDLANPANPDPMPGFATAGNCRMAAINGNTAYLASEDAGVEIVDLTGPSLITTIETSDEARGVTYFNGLLYIAHAGSGVSVYDVSNPADTPIFMGSVDSPGLAYEIVGWDASHVLLCDTYSLEAYEVTSVGVTPSYPTSSPISFTLNNAYPNPFNASSTLSFVMPSMGDVRVELFDSMGRLVSTPFAGELSQGPHNLTLNAENFASGTYLVKLSTPWGDKSQKLVLLK